MKIAIYLRVSTAEQSTDSQRVAIESHLKTHNRANFVFYEDEGVSGVKQSRPALNRLLAEIELGQIEVVITYSLSRLSRSVGHLLQMLEKFEANKIRFISVTENFDLATPAGKLLLNILGSIAQFEREIIVQRVKSGLEAAKKRGKKLGRPKTRNSQLITKLKQQGLSLRKIASVVGCSLATVQAELASHEKTPICIQPPPTA